MKHKILLGAIAGDVIGSVYEFNHVLWKDFELITRYSCFTDDTVMTVANADWLVSGESLMGIMQEYGNKYRGAGYGGMFYRWLMSSDPQPYNSFGNGSAMRVSPVGWAFNTLEETLAAAKQSAEVTHNHPEGIKGAQATAACIFLARTGSTKEEIKTYIEKTFGYDLSRTCDEIRPVYGFNETCQRTVPESIIAFLESTDFEDAIRLTVSLGGDADTMGAITGAIAEAYYKEIPEHIVTEVLKRLPDEFKEVMERFYEKYVFLMEIIADKIKGSIFGQAIGDALGLGTEFMSAEEVKHHYPDGLRDYSQIIQDKHRRRFVKGRWTDDTDMMFCVLDGIKNSSEIDVVQVAGNFKKWADGVPMGIGRHTYEVLSFWDYLQDPFRAAEIVWELSGRESAANGGIMRTSAVGLLKECVSEYAEKVCKLTHPDPRCIKSCILISELISSLIWECTELDYDKMVSVVGYDAEFIQYLSKANECTDISQLELDDPKSMGYTYKAMSAALWALWHCSSFEEGLLDVVNAGGDADTNAAVACSVLGAKYGFSAIPEKYVQGLYASDLLDKISDMITKKLLH